jgi:hypothetical protein
MGLATLGAVTEEMSARLTMSRLRTRGNRPRARAFQSRCQKGNLSYLTIIKRCAIVEAEFQIVAAVGLPKQKRVTDENNSFVT